MKELKTGELRKATPLKEVYGHKLRVAANPRVVNTRYGQKQVLTIVDEHDGVEKDIFLGSGMSKQELTVGDRFELGQVPTTKGNPMWIARSVS